MGFEEARVILDRENHTYFTGETVHGRLQFHLAKVKNFRGLYVRMKGYCEVHWTSERSHEVTGPNGTKRRVSETVQHNSHETYFEQKVYLVGGETGDHHLNAGSHEFPFQCHVPVHCPSSYESRNGHVRYELRCVVDRPWKFDQEKVVNFNVIARRDLNSDPYCKQPAEFHFVESYCSCCRSAGICEVKARLPASGYCPGQTIRIDLSCDNKSNVDIDAISLELKEETTWRAEHEPAKRHEKHTLAKIKKRPIMRNTERIWVVEMEVPVIDVRNLDACKFIDVHYEFEVKVHPDGCHSATSATRRMILGHIPLKDFEDDFKQPNNPYVTPVVPNQPYPGAISPGNVPYPGPNQPYPDKNAYPGGNPPYPGGNPPYPGGNPPYPGGNLPYPGSNPPYPGGNPQYPGGNPPYPAGNPPYPSGGNPSYPGGNLPYPGSNPPYPGANAPLPGGNIYPSVSPYPVPNPTPGFIMPPGNDGTNAPLLGRTSPYPPGPPPSNAAAPEPSTPDFYKPPPAFNPEYKE